jgi:hypothetical protein
VFRFSKPADSGIGGFFSSMEDLDNHRARATKQIELWHSCRDVPI